MNTKNKLVNSFLENIEGCKLVLDSSPDFILILDTEFNVVWVNRTMADKFGITPEECIGLTCYNVVHGTDGPPSFCPHKHLLEDGHEHAEEIHEDILGGDFIVSSSPLRDAEGNILGSVHVARDINERKRKEKELYQINKSYMALSNSSQAMTRAKNELEYLEAVCNIVVKDCGHSMVWIGYAEDDECKTVRPVAHAGFGEGYLETLNITWADNERGSGPTGTAIRTEKPIACINMHKDPKFEPWRENAIKRGYSSSLALPLIRDGNAFGALTIYSREPNSFSKEEIKLLTELAEDLAYGINAIRLRIALEQSENALKEARDNLELQVKERTLELEEAYESLKFANNYNRSLIEANLDPLVTIGSDGKITDVNYSTELATGYFRDEIIGTDFSDYFTEPEKARKGYQKVFREGWVLDYPLEIKHKDGRVTPVLYNASVYKDELGNVIGVFAAARDITEIKQAEDEIKRQAELLNLTQEAIIVRDMDSKILFWNNGAVKTYGWTMEEASGKITHSLLQTEFPIPLKEINEELISKGQWDGELVHTKCDNTKITVLSRQVLKKDGSGNLISILEINSDISERKKMEEELEFAGKYNRNLIETSLDPFVTIGPDGKITDINGVTEAVTGYSREELIGTDFSDYFTEPEKAREGYKQTFRDGWVIDYPLEIKHRNGHITPVLYNTSVYEDEFGDVIGVFAAARDITERKKAEKMLKLKLEELACSNAELEQFAYVSSHDLQEPLRMIGSYLQLLQRRYHGELDDKADKYIDFAVDGASRMQNLINDLLEFSRVTTRAKEFKSIDCEFILNQVLSNLEVSINENEAIISHNSLPTVMADFTQLTQVFQNLISNAIKFRSEKTPKITISAREENDNWIFSVADNGIGIDPEHCDRIFEVFKRLHKRREYPGTGIGLSICKKIVERHGGHIWVESEHNNGSIFYFTLPINHIEN
jgi:PAS domain S-box-containing protein